MTAHPTELQLHIAVMTTAVAITRAALAAGAPQDIAPRWDFPDGMISGHFTSEDDSALLALTAWRAALGTHRISSYSYSGTLGARRAWVVATSINEVSVRLYASIPAQLAAAPRELVAA